MAQPVEVYFPGTSPSTVARKGSCGPTRKLILFRTQSWVRSKISFFVGPQESLVVTAKRQKLAWSRNVTGHDSLSKTILQGTLENGWHCGWQRKCWMDNILLQKAREEDLCWIIPHVLPMAQSIEGLNWSELHLLSIQTAWTMGFKGDPDQGNFTGPGELWNMIVSTAISWLTVCVCDVMNDSGTCGRSVHCITSQPFVCSFW